MLPFIVTGVGLDDAIIIYGSYSRTDPTKSPKERIEESIYDVGLSITLTTLTSATAFGLGCISSVPAVYWLCLYAAPSISFVFVFQLSFFVACIVLDERRIQERRFDILTCFKASEKSTGISSKYRNEDKVCISKHFGTSYLERLLHGNLTGSAS